MKLMSQLPAALRAKIMARWTVSAPDPASDADVPLVAHPEVWATLQAVAGRTLDGYELYQHLKAGGHPYDGVNGVTAPQQNQLDTLTPRFTGWFDDLIAQPSGPEAFDPARLEHRFTRRPPPARRGNRAVRARVRGRRPGVARLLLRHIGHIARGGRRDAGGYWLSQAAGRGAEYADPAVHRGRPAPSEVLNPAEEIAGVYRALAETPGADKVQIAQTLLDLCDEVTPLIHVSGPPYLAEAAVAVLKSVTPAPADAGFLRLQTRALNTLIQRYIAAGRTSEVLNPAEEIAGVYRALADTPGADKVQVAQTLLDLCDEVTPLIHVSGPPYLAEAAVAMLDGVTPAPGDAGFLRLKARALATLARALRAGRPPWGGRRPRRTGHQDLRRPGRHLRCPPGRRRSAKPGRHPRRRRRRAGTPSQPKPGRQPRS